MNKTLLLCSFLLAFLFSQCVPPKEEMITDINLDLKDELLQKIYNFQDEQNGDSLFHYFHHKDPTYRYASILAFASIKDPAFLDKLYIMLNDPIDEVKTAAAYAIGQIGEPADAHKLIRAFNPNDTLGHSLSNAAILEAVGKCGNRKMLENLATIETYQPTDTLLLEGQSWGIYRFGWRELISNEGTSRMLEYATDQKYPASVRLIAANYLYRFQVDLDEEAGEKISEAIPKEDDPKIRMSLAIALGKTKTASALNALIYQYNVEEDYRVKCNILRAFGNFEYENVQPTAFDALQNTTLPIALTAANYFLENGTAREASQYWRKAKDSLHWQVQLMLYKAANRHMPYYFSESKKAINWELKRRFENATNPYEKAETIRALAEYGWNFAFIKERAFPSNEKVVRTASIEALGTIADKDPDEFRKFFGSGYRSIRKEISNYLIEAIQNGDPGMIYEAARAIQNKASYFKSTIDSLNFLEDALKNLKLPREIETYNQVNAALNFFKRRK